MAPGKSGGLDPVHALLHLHHHDLDGNDGVVDEKAEREDQRIGIVVAVEDPHQRLAAFTSSPSST